MRCLLHFRLAGQDSIQFAECLKAGTVVLTRKLQPSIKVCCRYFIRSARQVEGVQAHALVEPARMQLVKIGPAILPPPYRLAVDRDRTARVGHWDGSEKGTRPMSLLPNGPSSSAPLPRSPPFSPGR